MKLKIILPVVICQFFLIKSKLIAQENLAFDKGTVVITAGYGFPDLNRTSLRSTYSNYSSTTVSGIGPLILKGDYGLVKFKWGHTVGVGMVLGFSNTQLKYNYLAWGGWNPYTETDKYTTFTIGAHGSYHFYTKEKIDCYANVGIGFNINNETRTSTAPFGIISTSPSSNQSSIYEGFTVGARYYFTKHIGAYLEAGWDMHAPVQGGLAIKF